MVERVLVTGGAGFLGSHLCESLLHDEYEVVCVDNLGSGQLTNIRQLRNYDNFRFKKQDIREELDVDRVDYIYHLASRASPTDFTDFPVRIALTNTTGTKKLLERAVEFDARMIFASTSEIYGDPEVTPQPESYSGNVNIRGPRGCYDESKRFGETLTVAYMERYGIDVRTARIFNTYGPRMRPDDGRVVPTFITQALNDEDLTVYGDGTQTRSFCYVSDLINGLRKIGETDSIAGEVINLGNNNEISILELARIIIDQTETNSDIVHQSLPEDDPQRRCPDLTKAKDLLGWNPEISLQKGIRKTVPYYR